MNTTCQLIGIPEEYVIIIQAFMVSLILCFLRGASATIAAISAACASFLFAHGSGLGLFAQGFLSKNLR